MSNDYSHENLVKGMPDVRVAFFLATKEYETDVDLNTITQTLGIMPTRARKKTDFPSGSQKAGLAHDSWNLDTPRAEKCYSVSEPLEELLTMLKGKSDIIKCLAETFGMKTRFVVYIHTNKPEGNPQMLFPRRVIEFMASIGAGAGIDYYRY